jgi:hypothetical protein
MKLCNILFQFHEKSGRRQSRIRNANHYQNGPDLLTGLSRDRGKKNGTILEC